MAHTTFTTELLTDEQQSKIQSVLIQLGLSATFTHVEPHFTYRVWHDEFTDINFIREFTSGVIWLSPRAERRYALSDKDAESPFTEDGEGGRYQREDVALCLPIYLVDHSGISVSHGDFGCPWDSGQIGWHYMTHDVLNSWFGGDMDAARRCLEVEIAEVDAILRGDVWGYSIFDEEGDIYESCGGFIDTNGSAALDQILDHAAKEHHDGLREAWGCRFGS